MELSPKKPKLTVLKGGGESDEFTQEERRIDQATNNSQKYFLYDLEESGFKEGRSFIQFLEDNPNETLGNYPVKNEQEGVLAELLEEVYELCESDFPDDDSREDIGIFEKSKKELQLKIYNSPISTEIRQKLLDIIEAYTAEINGLRKVTSKQIGGASVTRALRDSQHRLHSV